MEGNKITEEELEEQGWKYISTYADNLKIFKKGDKYVFWNSETQVVFHEFKEDKDY